MQLRGLPTVERVVGGADLPAIAAALDLRAERFDAADATSDGHARAAPRPGRLRRALHVLRDDDGARRESQPVDRRARSRGVGSRRAACRNRDHRNSHRHVRRGHRVVAGRARCSGSLSRVPDVRFRLSSIEATEIDDALAELLVGRRRDASRRTCTRRCSPGRIGCCDGWVGIGIRALLTRTASSDSRRDERSRTWRRRHRRLSR